MKRKPLKRMISIGTAAAMLLLTACGSASTGTDAKTTDKAADAVVSEGGEVILNVWHQWANDTMELKRLYDDAVADYMAENPNVKIVTQTLDTEAYKTKIAAEFTGDASGIDVFYYWGAGTARKLVNADKLLPLDEYLTAETKAKILPGSTAAFEFNGNLYSVPSFSWYMTLFCNTELFDQAGAKIPETYDELMEACTKLSELDGVTPLVGGAKDGWNAAFIYQALAMREVGADKINRMLNGEEDFTADGYKDAAEKVIELYNIGAFGKNPLETSGDDANSSFISGKAGMRIMGSWFANQVYTDEAATIDPAVVTAVKIPMISGKGNETDYCGGFVESFWVNNKTQYKEEAAKFAIYINERIGKAAYETGTGFCGWDVELDESNLNPLFIQIKDLVTEGENGVLAWDTSLDANPATIHNEQAQTLFSPGADPEIFIEEHMDAIN